MPSIDIYAPWYFEKRVDRQLIELGTGDKSLCRLCIGLQEAFQWYSEELQSK